MRNPRQNLSICLTSLIAVSIVRKTMIRSIAFTVGLTVMVLALTFPLDARAGSLYVVGTTVPEGFPPASTTLGILNTATGQITSIGSLSEPLGGLALAPNNTLYGLGFNGNLYTVNATTAALTLVGPTGVAQGSFSLGIASDGTLYNDSAGVVYTVNPNTGAATRLGSLGFATGAQIDGDASGNLYIVNNSNESLYSVSRTTGATTLIGPGTYTSINGMVFSDGTMYAIEVLGKYGIFSLNLTDGASTLISNYNPSIIGSILAAADIPSAQSVPEPSSFTLTVIASLALIGCRVVRSR